MEAYSLLGIHQSNNHSFPIVYLETVLRGRGVVPTSGTPSLVQVGSLIAIFSHGHWLRDDLYLTLRCTEVKPLLIRAQMANFCVNRCAPRGFSKEAVRLMQSLERINTM